MFTEDGKYMLRCVARLTAAISLATGLGWLCGFFAFNGTIATLGAALVMVGLCAVPAVIVGSSVTVVLAAAKARDLIQARPGFSTGVGMLVGAATGIALGVAVGSVDWLAL